MQSVSVGRETGSLSAKDRALPPAMPEPDSVAACLLLGQAYHSPRLALFHCRCHVYWLPWLLLPWCQNLRRLLDVLCVFQTPLWRQQRSLSAVHHHQIHVGASTHFLRETRFQGLDQLDLDLVHSPLYHGAPVPNPPSSLGAHSQMATVHLHHLTEAAADAQNQLLGVQPVFPEAHL